METRKQLKHVGDPVDMPGTREGPSEQRAGWWAMYLLELGHRGDYDLLIHYLNLAQQKGCLTKIRLAAEELVRAEKALATPVKPIKPTRRKSGTFKAVA